ncbi:hypothetical protein C0Q70_18367 [Pomacea canaliculata]|uniref:Uncharacterized protein n=1 Tax=Pomacea canaliculata TaxID=400727 RepID=A0A2T7NN02_POMCA|nr:hypothetical protein C0Q70_18367 [Pomacea canaliculata]
MAPGVNGGFSSWSLLTEGSCSLTCGGGTKTLTYRRLCNSPPPQYGGTNCTGDYFKKETLWLDNGTCSVTCGEGLMDVTYERECDSPAPQYNGSSCLGNNTKTEIVICDYQSCPVDGSWSSWQWLDNGTCSVTCGEGLMEVTYTHVKCDRCMNIKLQFRTTLWRRDLRKETSPGHKLQSAARSLLRDLLKVRVRALKVRATGSVDLYTEDGPCGLGADSSLELVPDA